MEEQITPIVWAEEPNTWPAAPEWMSFYRLRETEACPRRVALKSAMYPRLWNRPGYPPKLRLPALFGQVVHLALRTLGAKLAQAGCSSASEIGAVTLLKNLGGLSQVINKCVDGVFAEQAENPRGGASRKALFENLKARLPQLREQVQIKLSHLQFGKVAPVALSHRKQGALPSQTLDGSHSEVELRAPSLRWIGIADYVALFGNYCEIVDFKSGNPEQEHKLQILIYALLWARDQNLNPDARIANKLTLSYETGTIDVPAPSKTELRELEENIQTRTELARNALGTLPPDARPSLDNCRFCDVRHLCSAYWKPQTQQQFAQHELPSSDYVDLEMRIVSQQAMKSWKGIVTSSQILQPGTHILLRTSVFDNSLDEVLLSAMSHQVRILDGRLCNPSSDGSPAIITLSERSEAFLLKSRRSE